MTYEPLHRNRPPHRWTYGDIACRVGADLGLPPDAEQAWLLDTTFAEKAHDRPASFEVGTIAPRQNIKTSTMGIAALADLFVFGIERHIWSSHLVDTTKSTFRDFKAWIESNHEYAEQVDYFEGHQDLAIIRTDPVTGVEQRIEFRSRTGKSSRGLTGVKRITLDEWLYGEPKHVGAVYPTMLTRPGSQVRIMSSAGLLASAQLRALRDRGRAGKDNRLAYVEYGAERRRCQDPHCGHKYGIAKGCALDDRELWWQASCALWSGRILEESIEDLRKSMPPEEFMREMLSWWEDPVSEGGALPFAAWQNLADPTAERPSSLVFGIDVTEDRMAWIAVAWWRPDGTKHVVLANEGRALPAHALVEESKRLARKWSAIVMTAPAYEDDLDRAGVQSETLSPTDFAVGCGAFSDAITAGTVHHGNQPALNDGVKATKWRAGGVSTERAFQLKDSPEVGPVAAAVRALRGLDLTVPFSMFSGDDLDACDGCGKDAGPDAADRDYLCEACWAEQKTEDL